MEKLYNERKNTNVTMAKLHANILGSESWNVSASMSKFFENSEKPKSHSIQTSDAEPKLFLCEKITDIADVKDGTLLSPNYPNNYPHGIQCGWNVKAIKGTKMIFQFVSFDIAVSFFVKIIIERYFQ